MSRQDNTFGVYIHVPFCKHACPYCDFYKIELRDRPARDRLDFPARLRNEFAMSLRQIEGLRSRKLETIYFGGGTPSTLVPDAVSILLKSIQEEVGNQAMEVTLEANPENLTANRARQWKAAGINRLSIGVQSFLESDLQRLERLHEPQTIYTAVRNAREAGFENISIDLMFALPGQGLEQWLANLEKAVTLKPDHLSFYGLTYHEGTPFYDWLQQHDLEEIGEDDQAQMYSAGSDFLQDNGYRHYEISNFAKPGYESLHNQRYWKAQDVVGIGPGAHSNVENRRWRNPDDLEFWAAAIDDDQVAWLDIERLESDVEMGELLYRRLRTIEGLGKSEHPLLYKKARLWFDLALPEASKWACFSEDRFALTRDGWLIADAIVDAILHQETE